MKDEYDFSNAKRGAVIPLTLKQAIKTIKHQQKRYGELTQLVNEQAKDEGLWFEAKTAPEAYLQAALRKCHALIES